MSFFAQAGQAVNQAGMELLGGFIERKVEADNAKYFESLAKATLKTGRRRSAGTIERARVNFAASGVRLDEGSPQDFVLALQEEGELAALEASYPFFEEARRARFARDTAIARAVVKAQLSIQNAGSAIGAGLLERGQPGGVTPAGQPGNQSILGNRSGGGNLFLPNNSAGGPGPGGDTILNIGQFGGIV